MYPNFGHMGGLWLYWVAGLAFFVLVLWWASQSRRQSPGDESAEEVLKRRYANGEIEREEYLRTLDELRR